MGVNPSPTRSLEDKSLELNLTGNTGGSRGSRVGFVMKINSRTHNAYDEPAIPYDPSNPNNTNTADNPNTPTTPARNGIDSLSVSSSAYQPMFRLMPKESAKNTTIKPTSPTSGLDSDSD